MLNVVGSVVGQAARADSSPRRIRRRLGEAFSGTNTEILSSRPEDAAKLIGRRAAEVLGTSWYGVYVPDGDVVHLVDDRTEGHFVRTVVPLSEKLPVTDVVRTRAPVVVADAEEWAERYPAMRNFPPAPALNLPLYDELGDVAIVLGIGFPSETRVPPWVIEHLDEIVEGWSEVYNARSRPSTRRVAEREHNVAVALQHAMLGQPDPVLWAEWAPAYRPADGTLEVGGDWYDVIDLGDRRVGVVVGDVVGHHLAAAAAMGQLRSAVRTLAPTIDDPAELLTRLDGIVEHIDGAMSATMLYGVLDCDTGTFRYSGAGHLPPLLVTVDGDAVYLDGGRNVPLGGFVTRPRETALAHVSVQDWLVLYSDGLVERRGESLDVGLDRLLGAGRTGRLRDAPGLCNHFVNRLLANEAQRDDVAVLAVRPIPAEIRLRRPAEPGMLRGARGRCSAWLRAVDASADEIDELVLSAGEALTNAIEHADARGVPATVELGATEHEGVVRIEVREATEPGPCACPQQTRRGTWSADPATFHRRRRHPPGR